MIMLYDITVTRHMEQSNRLSFRQCGIEHCVPGHSDGPRIRQRTLIHVVIEGRGKIVMNKKTYHAHAGQAFLIPANVEAYYVADHEEPWKYCWISFLGEQKEACTDVIFGQDNYVKNIVCGQQIYGMIANTLDNYYDAEPESQQEKYGSKLHLYAIDNTTDSFKLNALTYDIIALMMSEEPKDKEKEGSEEYIDRIKNYVDEYFLEIGEISQLANAFHLHPNYLASRFKEKYHISPKKYIQERKLDYASYLLKNTEYSVQHIAMICGFTCVSSFGKVYKKYKSVSPGEYRKLNKKEQDYCDKYWYEILENNKETW